MNALTQETRIRWALPTPQKGATNRFAVLAARLAGSTRRRRCDLPTWAGGGRHVGAKLQNGAGTLVFRESNS